MVFYWRPAFKFSKNTKPKYDATKQSHDITAASFGFSASVSFICYVKLVPNLNHIDIWPEIINSKIRKKLVLILTNRERLDRINNCALSMVVSNKHLPKRHHPSHPKSHPRVISVLPWIQLYSKEG